MYPREVGDHNFRQMAKALKKAPDRRPPADLWLDVTVRSAGHRRTRARDLALFNRAVPNIGMSWTDPTTFVLRVGIPAPSLKPPFEVGEVPAQEMTSAVEGARRFLVALSIASQGVYTWREVTTSPRGVLLHLPGEDEPRGVEIAPTPFAINGAPTLHPGFLFGAIDVTTKLHAAGWSPRFFSLYLRGAQLLAAGADFLGSYVEEAYLCFYRCIEYGVMAKILDKRGKFDERRFAEALAAIGAKPADPGTPIEFARGLLRTRHTAVAHFLKGSHDAHIGVEDVARVKEALDVLTSEYVKHSVRTTGR